jgi:hypothetical protein
MTKHIFNELPPIGVWQLLDAYTGMEVVRFVKNQQHLLIDGTTVGVEDGAPWSIHYTIELDDEWRVCSAKVIDYAGNTLDITVDKAANWTINGTLQPELQGRLDLDFEASAVTNTIPVHRLALQPGEQGESAAVYIRSKGLAVEQLDQTYLRLRDEDNRLRYDYQSPRFGYHDTLRFDRDGLAQDYPGIGRRLQ